MAYPYGQQSGFGAPGYPQQAQRPGYGQHFQQAPGHPGAPGYPGCLPPAGTASYPSAPTGAPNAYPTGAPSAYPTAAPSAYPTGPAPTNYGLPGHGHIDPQLAQWFHSVDQDHSGAINAVELRQALVNGNWTNFNMDVCQRMIGMFDKDRTGTIDLNEFQALWHYIQQWRSTFDRFDANRSGSIEHHELMQAYQTMGFNVTPSLMQAILFKFDSNSRRSLALDGFIHSCICLKSLTAVFQQRDTSRSGTILLTYEDFIAHCLSF